VESEIEELVSVQVSEHISNVQSWIDVVEMVFKLSVDAERRIAVQRGFDSYQKGEVSLRHFSTRKLNVDDFGFERNLINLSDILTSELVEDCEVKDGISNWLQKVAEHDYISQR
jgi:hypothetical protein